MKNCEICNIDISERRAAKYCIECAKISNNESIIRYKIINKSKIEEYGKKHYEDNKERLRPIRKKWRDNNREKVKNCSKEEYIKTGKERLSNYYIENKEEINNRKKKYRKTEEYKKWKKEYDLKNIYKQRYRDSLRSVIRRLDRDKNDYTNKLLGYSDIDFKIHIESQFVENMSWENRNSFEVDHIIPIVAFIENTPLNIVSSIDNLKPMNPTENIKKFISIDYNYIKLYEKYIDYLIPEYKEEIIKYLEN